MRTQLWRFTIPWSCTMRKNSTIGISVKECLRVKEKYSFNIITESLEREWRSHLNFSLQVHPWSRFIAANASQSTSSSRYLVDSLYPSDIWELSDKDATAGTYFRFAPEEPCLAPSRIVQDHGMVERHSWVFIYRTWDQEGDDKCRVSLLYLATN